MLKVLKMGCKGFARHRKHYVGVLETRGIKSLKVENVPDVTVSSIRARLVKHEVGYEERPNNFVIGCPSCRRGGKSLSDKAKIFINKRTGAFVCEFCHHTGSWTDIESYISAKYEKCKDPAVVDELNALAKYVRDIKKNAIQLSSLSDGEFDELKSKFELPPTTSKERTHELGVLLDITRSNLYFPLTNTVNVVVGYLRLKSKGGQTNIEPQLLYTESTGVLLSRSTKNKDTAVIVSNLSDFLVLISAQIPYPVICLPNGLVGLSQYILPCFERYSKLVLWFGNDLISWDVARSYTRKLGERRCLLIRPVDRVASPHEDPGQNFKAVIQGAQPIWHRSITTFASLREDILADLQNIDRVQGVKWTRFPILNKLLKGHRRGELTVLTGPTGSGKTTFISEYSLDLAMQGVTTLWGSFEIRNARLARTMLQQMAGVPLDEHLEKYDSWADKFEQLPIYYMTFHGQQTIKVVMEAIEHATYVHDISHVIIDNLQFMMGLSEDVRNMDRFWKQDLIISHFRTFATRRNCHVTLVIHPRKEKQDEDLTMSSIFGGAKASQEADNILIVQDKRLLSVRGKSFLQIAKNRYSGDVGVMPLDFDKASLSFVQKPKRKAEQHQNPDAQAPT